MTSPTGGDYSLSVDILPDASNFGDRLRQAIERLRPPPTAPVKAEPVVRDFASDLREALKSVNMPQAAVRVDPNVRGFDERVRRALQRVNMPRASVALDADTADFRASVAAAIASVPSVTIDADNSAALTSVAAIGTAIRALPTTVNLDVDTGSAAASIANLRATIQSLQVGSINIDLDTTAADARINALRARLASLNAGTIRVRVTFPDVDRVGERLGRAAATEFIRAFNAAMAAAPWGSPGPSASQSGRAGGSAGGAYAATFRRVVTEALQNLPEPTIGVATSAAEQSIRDIRASLERLADERVGVTITGEQARAEVRRIREDLERLKAISPITVQAKADAAAAQLVLDRLEAQLAAVGRDRTANVRVRTDHSQLNALQTALLGSTNRMQLLITAGLALGPAIVPAAAAAAAAIGAIGGAAIAAGAGLGVGVLALSGVVGAVKALSDARNDAAKTAATEAKQDKQLASGADQVRSAVASLANTRAQAASQARQSAQAIADSERGLADAQRDALRAQQDITRAREDAKDALEDLDSSIKANATSIKQANLDLADAEAALAKVRNLPPDNRARIEAEIAYERAKQNIDDLTTRQGRLAEEKQKSDKAGIEGSAQVVAAQERINDAQRRVQDAERAVGEARTAAAEQARQSAFSIAQAQQAVVAAQRSVATSAVSTAATSGAAMDTLREKMANLSPEGRRFAEFIVGMQPALIGLRQSAEQALPGFQRGLQELLPFLPAVNDFIRRIAVTLGDMGEATGKALSSDRLRPFFTYISDTAAGTLRQLGSAIGNVTVAIGNLVVGFAPVQRQLVTGLVDMTRRFEDWSRSLDANNGFQRFISYAIVQGPIVLRTLGDLTGALVHILEASRPMGTIVLNVLSGIANAINSIPVPVLTVLLTAMTALRIASLLAVIPLGNLGLIISTMPGRLIAMTTSLGAARVGIASFASALGGPVVLGIAAVIAGMALLGGSTSKVKDNFAALQSGLDSYRDAFKDGLTPAAIDNARALLAQNSALSEFVQRAQAAGISSDEIVRGLNGEAGAREKIQKALDDQIDALYREREAIPPAMKAAREANQEKINGLQAERRAFLDTSLAQANANTQAGALASSTERLVEGMNLARQAVAGTTLSTEGYSKALSALGEIGKGSTAGFEAIAGLTSRIAESNLDAAGKAKLFGEALKQIGASSATSGPQFDALSSVFTNIANSSLNATDKVKLLREAMEKLYGAAISQVEADENVIRTKDALTTQLGTNSAGFDLNKAKGKENTEAILANRDSLQAALVALREKYLQDLANGVSEDVAREAHRKNTEQILKGIEPTQRSSGAVGELVKTYGSLPDKKTTEVTTPGLDEAIDKMVEAHAIQMGLDQKPPWTKDQISAEATYLKNMINGRVGQSAMRKAEGGIIPGWSPNPKADNIPAWLTAGEHVQPVEAVRYYGVDFMERLRRREIPRDLIRGYAGGGSVMPLTIPASVKYPVNPEDLWRKWDAAQAASARLTDYGPGPGFPPWPSSPGAQRGDSGVWRSIVALIRSTGPLSGSFGNSYRPGDPLWHGCVPMDTTILTRRGWISRDEIRIGEDETIGYNPATGKNEWTRIVDVVEYDDAELWTLKNKWVEIEVTPGHKWLVDQQVTVQTETVCTECGREFATGRGMTKHRADVHGVLTPRRERYEEQLVATQDFKQSTRVHLSKPADLGGQLPITDDEAELIGWIFADGYMEPYGPTIVQSKPKEVQYLKRFMAKFPHSIYRRPPKGTQRYEIFRFALTWEYWQDLSSRSKASKADALNFVFSLSPSQREAFLGGFLSADGSRDPRTQNEKLGFSGFQVSGPMAEAIKVAAYLEGYRPDTKVTTEFDEARFGTQPMERIGFRTPIVKGRNLPVVAKRTAKVWCPTTTLGTWTARQGEEIFLTGNSGRAVDWMGFNQDALATFLASKSPLELIHRTPTRDYAYTRGRNKGSFHESLMQAHRNHVHIAMADGGLVPNIGPSLAQTLNIPHLIRDEGGWIPPGLSLVSNQTGSYEAMFNQAQIRELAGATSGGKRGGGDVHIDNFNAYAGQSPHEIARDLDWIGRHGG